MSKDTEKYIMNVVGTRVKNIKYIYIYIYIYSNQGLLGSMVGKT